MSDDLIIVRNEQGEVVAMNLEQALEVLELNGYIVGYPSLEANHNKEDEVEDV